MSKPTRSMRSILTARQVILLQVLTMAPLMIGAASAQEELFRPVQAGRAAGADQSPIVERLRQRPTTQSLDLVEVDVNALRGDSVRLSIPNTPSLVLSRRSQDVRSADNFTYYGTLGTVPGEATLVVRNGNITGSIQDQGTLYRIEPVGNGVHALIKVYGDRFPPEHPPSFEEKERRGDIRAPARMRDANRSDGLADIDVLVAYTPGAQGNVADIDATIQLAVAEANQSYANSAVRLKLNVVDSFLVPLSESGKDFDTIIAEFKANPTVQQRRDSKGADLAVMIIDKNDFCGMADAIMADASTAFAVVHYDCATGYYSFAHELGHLQGARHDPVNDPTSMPFSYGHGFQHLSPPPAWRTIMAYACSGGCPRLQYWANPNVQYNGIPMGHSATNDDARVLNETASTVAGFRSVGN